MGHDERFRQVNRYSAVHGFAAGFPNFHEADHGQGVVYGTQLLRTAAVEWRDVPRAVYGNANIDDVPALFRAANDYAGDNGFEAGFPTFEQGIANGSVVYGTNLIRPGITEFRDVLRADLGSPNLSDVPAMMRAADDYAGANGFPAAFPTFHQANHGAGVVYGLIVFKPGMVAWRDIPATFLRRYTRPTKWAVVLCYASDGSAGTEQTKAKFRQFFTPEGRGTGGAVDYWWDVSYGTIDMEGSEVFGWFDLGATFDDIDARTSHDQRAAVLQWGRAAASRGGVTLGNFDHVLVFLNRSCDSGSVGHDVVIGMATPIAAQPLFTRPGFVEHEMGHALGLYHGFGEQPTTCATTGGPGEYCNPFTMMSYALVTDFILKEREHPPWDDVRGGPGLNARELEKLGAIDFTRIWTAPSVPFSQTVTLAAVNRPDVEAPLMARFTAASRTGTGENTYVLEYREPTKWDRGFPGPMVLIYEVRTARKFVLLTDFSGGMFPSLGAIFLTPDSKIAVRLESINRAASTATVRIWTVRGQGAQGVIVKRIIANPPGADPPRERVILENTSTTAVNLTGWTLSDAKGHVYAFPSFTVPEGFVFTVWTGKGVDTFANLYWQRAAAVWNNQGDTATLRNAAGDVIDTFTYP